MPTEPSEVDGAQPLQRLSHKETDLKSYKRRRTKDEREGTALAVGFDQFFLQLRMQQTWQLALTLWSAVVS